MVVVDSSALLAILLKESDWTTFLDALNSFPRKIMAAPNWLEACLVFDNRGNDYVTGRLDQVVRGMKIDIVPFDAVMAEIARFAHRRFGRGSKHPAQLNFGDCIAYALARTTGAPLLFKGNDFPQTDMIPALTV